MTAAAFVPDLTYQARLTDVILNAVMREMQDGEGRVILRTGDIVHVLTQFQAIVLAGSPPVSTPTRRREFCAEHAKVLQRAIAAAEASPDTGFLHRVTIEGELH